MNDANTLTAAPLPATWWREHLPKLIRVYGIIITLGGFKRSSQWAVCRLTAATGQAPLRAFSIRGSCGASH